MCDFAAFCHWFSCSLSPSTSFARSTIRASLNWGHSCRHALWRWEDQRYACLYPQYACAENQGRADELAVRLCQLGVHHVMRHESYDPVTSWPPAFSSFRVVTPAVTAVAALPFRGGLLKTLSGNICGSKFIRGRRRVGDEQRRWA